MKVQRLKTAPTYEPEEFWRRYSLCNEEDVSLERFVKPPGHASPRHEHPSAQVLIVLEGKLVISTDKDGEVELEEGDTAYIPGGETHVVRNPLETPSSGIDIFVPGRSFDFWYKAVVNERKEGRTPMG